MQRNKKKPKRKVYTHEGPNGSTISGQVKLNFWKNKMKRFRRSMK